MVKSAGFPAKMVDVLWLSVSLPECICYTSLTTWPLTLVHVNCGFNLAHPFQSPTAFLWFPTILPWKQGEPENPKDKPDTCKPIFNERLMSCVRFVIWVSLVLENASQTWMQVKRSCPSLHFRALFVASFELSHDCRERETTAGWKRLQQTPWGVKKACRKMVCLSRNPAS